ncbi:hypothetical protein FOCC_FOCC006385 [Frankliniella occidentalis]|nr:hypothetical protein FOCC_FOCC006385 [Frankliniella occidentalis]
MSSRLSPDKIRKRYGPAVSLAGSGGSVELAVLERGPSGLGLSLAGHKDRARMAVLVCGLNPNGTAYKNGDIKVGDEILEGRCHLNASAIIKGLPGPVFKVVVLRREAAVEELAVKPLTQFPVSLDDETPEERYKDFKGLRTVLIKKGPQGLGIMIIEGKHAEVGQGIFISDIQEGSAAEQAGLTVGDMILAVNKDSLLGSNYDAAASLLKETKGMVNLVVCNPNKAKEEEGKGADGKLNAKGSTARSPTPTQPAAPEKPRLLDSQNVTVPASSRTAHHSPSRHPEQPALPPATAPVVAGQETTIEIAKEEKALGIFVVGGSDTPLGVIVIHEIYPDGAVAKDGRLKVGDQILEVGGPKDSVTHDFHSITHAKAIAALRQLPAKVKMIVYRDEAVEKEEDIYESIEVELTKKSGKGLGLSLVVRKDGKGVYISDLVHGGAAEADGRLMKGDMILSVNGQDLKSASQEEAAAVLKTALGKVTVKVGRIKTGKINERSKTSVPVPAAPTAPEGTLPAPATYFTTIPDSHLISFPTDEPNILVSPKRSSSFLCIIGNVLYLSYACFAHVYVVAYVMYKSLSVYCAYSSVNLFSRSMCSVLNMKSGDMGLSLIDSRDYEYGFRCLNVYLKDFNLVIVKAVYFLKKIIKFDLFIGTNICLEIRVFHIQKTMCEIGLMTSEMLKAPIVITNLCSFLLDSRAISNFQFVGFLRLSAKNFVILDLRQICLEIFSSNYQLKDKGYVTFIIFKYAAFLGVIFATVHFVNGPFLNSDSA